jgi:hypothetical protein
LHAIPVFFQKEKEEEEGEEKGEGEGEGEGKGKGEREREREESKQQDILQRKANAQGARREKYRKDIYL